MLHTRLVNALKKAGATVTDISSPNNDSEFHRHFEAEYEGKKIDWHTSENWNERLGDYDGKIGVDTVWERSPHTDIMTDLFMDSYYKTIKGAVWALTGER